MLEVLQNSGVGPKAANNPHATSAQAVASHRYRGRAGIGDKMLELARKAGSRDCLRRQQREDGEKNDATPRKEAQQFYDEVGAGHQTVIGRSGAKSGAARAPRQVALYDVSPMGENRSQETVTSRPEGSGVPIRGPGRAIAVRRQPKISRLRANPGVD